MKFLLQALVLLPLLAGALPAPDAEVEVEPDKHGKIPNAYIVALKETVDAQGVESHLSWLDSVTKEVTALAGRTQTYDFFSFQGYAGEFDDKTVALIKARPDVDIVEQDGIVQTVACTKQTYSDIGLWGLGRISHVDTGPWMEYLYEGSQPYCNSKKKVAVYVIDSGVYTGHDEFGGRATHIATTFGKGDKDNCGHGTHVAATVAGATYGVMKTADVYAIKALDKVRGGSCSGSWTSVIGAIQIAAKHATKQGIVSRSVINMSLGGPKSMIVNIAVNYAVKGGLTVVVAAGNKGDSACYYSPASAPSAITVGASSIRDVIPSWSNTGCCVDLFAPGVDVLSAFIGSPKASMVYSGTSMASPHVAGVVLYLKCQEGNSNPAQDRAALMKAANMGRLTGRFTVGGCSAPNALVFNRGCTV